MPGQYNLKEHLVCPSSVPIRRPTADVPADASRAPPAIPNLLEQAGEGLNDDAKDRPGHWDRRPLLLSLAEQAEHA